LEEYFLLVPNGLQFCQKECYKAVMSQFDRIYPVFRGGKDSEVSRTVGQSSVSNLA